MPPSTFVSISRSAAIFALSSGLASRYALASGRTAWLAEHPRFHIHPTPTSGSWLNAVERVFSDVWEKCLRRRSADSVEALQQAIGQQLERRNENPKPLHWKATAVEILRKVKRTWGVLHDRYGANKPSAALASIERFLDALDAAPG